MSGKLKTPVHASMGLRTPPNRELGGFLFQYDPMLIYLSGFIILILHLRGLIIIFFVRFLPLPMRRRGSRTHGRG